MTRFAVRLFGPGLAPAGEDASLICSDTGLAISELALPIPSGVVQLRRNGFDGKGIEISWHDNSGNWAVQLLDARQAASLLAALPPALHPARSTLKAGDKRLRGKRRWGWAAVALLLATPLMLIAAFFIFADALAGRVAQYVPVEHERRLGDISFASMKPTLKLRDASEASRIVREIGGRLTVGSRYTYRFHVVEDPSINAFAMPGGIVVVHSGLIAATRRPEELAGVLAHEVQHVEQRHSLEALIKQLGLRGLWTLLLGGAGGEIGSGMAGQAAQRMLGLAFSRDAEREADAEGLAALIRAGIDPTGMPDFFGKLSEKGITPPALLSTHPASTERQARLAALLREHAQKAPAPTQAPTPLPYSPWPPKV